MSSPETSPRLLLVDGHAYAYRAFHAIRSLNSPDGRPTNAIYGFVKMLLKLESVVRPTHRLVVWDAGLAAERMAALPGYKANRPPMPDALDEQMPQLQTWLAAAGWASLQEEGSEADDWLATYSRRAEAAGWRTVLASSDKDFMQLVNDRIGLFNPNDKTEKIWVAADVEAKTGVQPAQIVDWLSLVGDSVDNIPGVSGVGPKTATDLLKRFGNLEQLLARAGELKSETQRAAVQSSGEILRRNQLMIRLRDDLVGGHDLEALAPRPPEKPVLRELYRRWNFRSLLAELGEAAPPITSVPEQGSLF
jgi:DNA polymerase-1